MTFASVYPLYIAKVERKQHTKEELDTVITWLTGHTPRQLEALAHTQITFKEFFDQAPHLNPDRKLITGVICGIRVEDITEPLMQEIRYLDKLVDELANGKAMHKILRT
jgi:hypothetical protein